MGLVLGFGGLSTGLLAVGGGAVGEHVISGMVRDPEAVRFFSEWLPGLRELLSPR